LRTRFDPGAGAGGSVRLEIAPRLLTRYQRVGRNLAIEQELFGCCRLPIRYRERSERVVSEMLDYAI